MRTAMAGDANCKFCRILAGELPASIVYEDDTCVAFMDIRPVNPGHLLVVPRWHAKLISGLDASTAGHLLVVGAMIGTAIRGSDIRCDAISYTIADGEAAGQEVPHVHLHCIPRFAGDGFGPRFPRSHGMFPKREALDKMASQIESAIRDHHAGNEEE